MTTAGFVGEHFDIFSPIITGGCSEGLYRCALNNKLNVIKHTEIFLSLIFLRIVALIIAHVTDLPQKTQHALYI